jgi:hypothetical protein
VAEDVPAALAAGAAGVAVSSALYRDRDVERQVAEFLRARQGVNGASRRAPGAVPNGRAAPELRCGNSGVDQPLRVNP